MPHRRGLALTLGIDWCYGISVVKCAPVDRSRYWQDKGFASWETVPGVTSYDVSVKRE